MIKTTAILLLIAIGVSFYAVNQQSRQDKSSMPFDKNQHSITDPASLWVIVNKQRPLKPINYVPVQLHKVGNSQLMASVAAKDLVAMMINAKKSGLLLNLESGYRSYPIQEKAYNSLVSGFGQEAADQESARPGYSEHQTGLAMDFGNERCKVQDCFASTKDGQWLAANSYKYGFILRYPETKTAITGYKQEPWHFRYVGKSLAAHLNSKGSTTFEEFFGVKGGSIYK